MAVPSATISRSLRTPRGAGIAGVVFAVLLSSSLVILRLAEHARAGLSAVAVVPQLVPFAGIAFLWFMGVVRSRIGEYEDRFFATVFLGSGLLFVATLFVASAQAEGILSWMAATHPTVPTESTALNQSIAAVIIHMYAMRMAAVFTLSTATIGLRTCFIPRWLVFAGYAVAVILLLGIKISLWFELLFPFWILLLSVRILFETFNSNSAFGHPEHRNLGTAD